VFLTDVVNDPDLRILVVQLGVNDTAEKRTLTQIRADIRTFLQTAAPRVECVWWLDIKETGVINGNPIYLQNAPHFNDILREEAALFPNVHVAPYDAWTRAHPRYIWKDGLHLTDVGRAPYASWVETDLVNAC
jgi:lysophospholipase L1-like esterase